MLLTKNAPSKVFGLWSSMAMLTLFLAVPMTVFAQNEEADQPQTSEAQAQDNASKPVKLPGITIYPKEGYMDVEGRICLNQGLLEVFATTPRGKTHEAIVELSVPARNIHVGLLLLNAKNGAPGKVVFDENDQPQEIAPTGDPIKVSLVYTPKDADEPVEHPVSHFMIDGQGKPMKDTAFLFAGSVKTQLQNGKVIYEADNGNVISLVSFGDELLAFPTPASHRNSDLLWSINEKTIPPLNTKVIVRLKPVIQAKENNVDETDPEITADNDAPDTTAEE